MESIICRRSFEGSASEMLSWCRTLDSRSNWPGATIDGDIPDTLFYTIGIRLKSASMTDMHVEERLGSRQSSDEEIWFESAHRCTWPDIVVDARSEYRISLALPHELVMTYSYDNPGQRIVKAKNLPAFKDALEHVIDRYLEKLIAHVSQAA